MSSKEISLIYLPLFQIMCPPWFLNKSNIYYHDYAEYLSANQLASIG